jgi:hypothetical protein
MKQCVVVNYWANTEDKVLMVLDCINQLKKLGLDIVYTSLYEIDDRISNSVTHTIYSNENDLITIFDLFNNENIRVVNTNSFTCEEFNFYSIPLNWRDVSFSVSNQIIKNFNKLISLGYSHCHFIVGDCIISDSELDVLSTISKSCEITNKKAYFDDLSNRYSGFGAIYFYTDIEFFLSKFIYKESKDEHITHYSNENKKLLSFEEILDKNFRPYNDELLLGNNNSNTFGPIVLFKESEIDKVTSFNTTTDHFIVPHKDKSKMDLITIFKDNSEYKFEINDELISTVNGVPHWYEMITLPISEFNLKIYKDNIVTFNRKITNFDLSNLCGHICFYDNYNL